MLTVGFMGAPGMLPTDAMIPHGPAFMIRLLAFGATITGVAGRVTRTVAAMPGAASTAAVTASAASTTGATAVTTTTTTFFRGS